MGTTSAPLAAAIPRPPAVGFVARRDEEGRDIVERLKGNLDPAQQRLVVLWGPGGVGKTTLAAEAVREMAGVFGKRTVWAGAQKRADFNFDTLLDEIATQLGRADLRQFVTDKKVEQVVALLGESPALVVLDNFETLPTDEQKRCVEFLAERARCPILITTRENVAGTRNVRIQAMSPDEAAEFLTRLIDNTGNAQAFDGLDRDHIRQSAAANPLVMEWVVAQIALAQEPATVLDELAHGRGDAAQRVFDRSFQLRQLGDDGRAALLALSLFVPDASRPALAEAAAFDDDLARLNEAVRRLASLCMIGISAGGQRLRIDGLTRELSGSRLKQDKHADDCRRQFVAYFVRYAEAHPNQTPDDLNALEVEKENLIAAVDLAFELKDCQSVMRIAGELADVNGVLVVRGHWVEAIHCGEQAAEAAREAQNEWEIARFAEIVATIRYFRGELEEARRLYNESLEIQKKLGNQSGIASSLHNLGNLARDQGDLGEARRLYNESLEIKKKLADQSGIASSLHSLGWLAHDQGELGEARRLYNESLKIKKQLRDQSGIASSLHNLGSLAQDQGELDEARRLYNESLEITKELRDQSGIASSLHNLGSLAQDQGELDEARRLYNESLEITKELGDQSGIARSLHQLGMLAEKQGDRAEALRLFRQSLGIFEKLNSPDAEVAHRSIARVKAALKAKDAS